MRLITQLFLQIMKRKNNLLCNNIFIVLFSLLAICCQSPSEITAGGISENEIKKFCQRKTILATDVFRKFGKIVGGGDTLNGFFYDGKNNLTYIFILFLP